MENSQERDYFFERPEILCPEWDYVGCAGVELRRRRWEKRAGRARERKVSDEDIRFDNFG